MASERSANLSINGWLNFHNELVVCSIRTKMQVSVCNCQYFKPTSYLRIFNKELLSSENTVNMTAMRKKNEEKMNLKL